MEKDDPELRQKAMVEQFQKQLTDPVIQAQNEFYFENYRKKVEAIKQKMRERDQRTFWQKLIPYTITITRNT